MTARIRRSVPAFAGFAMLAAAIAGWALGPGLRDSLRERAFDLVLPMLSPPSRPGPPVVVVDIDRAALAQFGPWPWPRDRLAALVAAVAAARPAAIGIDILLAGTDRLAPTGDAALAAALGQAPSVLGFVLDPSGGGQSVPAVPVLATEPVSLPGLWREAGMAGPLGPLADAAEGLGMIALAADPDGAIRRVPLLVLTGATVRPGLAVEMLRVAQGAGSLLIGPGPALRIGSLTVPLGRDAMLRLRGEPASRWGVRTVSAAGLIGHPVPAVLRPGALVLIGGSAPELGGLRVTPRSAATPSVELEAEAIETMARGTALRRPAWAETGELGAAICLGVLCLVLALGFRPGAAAGLVALLCLGWAGAATAGAAPRSSLLVDPAGPPAVALTAFAAAALARFARDEWQARLLRRSFEQHLAPEVVRRIAQNPGALRLAGERREITALITDIEGFTAMTERSDPAELVELLDMYFDAATRAVTDRGGMIDKIVGDAVHGIFNAPLDLPDHPSRALESARALLSAAEAIGNRSWGSVLGWGAHASESRPGRW